VHCFDFGVQPFASVRFDEQAGFFALWMNLSHFADPHVAQSGKLQTKHIILGSPVEFGKRFLLRPAAMIVATDRGEAFLGKPTRKGHRRASPHKKVRASYFDAPRIYAVLLRPGIRIGEQVFPIETLASFCLTQRGWIRRFVKTGLGGITPALARRICTSIFDRSIAI